MKKLLFLLILLLIPLTCDASKVIVKGYKEAETAKYVEMTIKHLYTKYNLSLNNHLVVRVAKNRKQYIEQLEDFKYNYNPTAVADSTNAITVTVPWVTYVVINRESCGEKFEFILCHELVHVYQMEHYVEPYKSDYAMLEGKADLIAGEIMGCPVAIKDHGLSCEKMKDYEGHAIAIVENGLNKVNEQVRETMKKSL